MSSEQLAALKDVDDAIQALIAGYFREYQYILSKSHDNNPYYNIPQLSISLTILFYTLTGYKILPFDAEYIAADGNIRLTNENKIALQGRSGNNYYVLCGGEPAKFSKTVWRLNVCYVHTSFSFSYQFR